MTIDVKRRRSVMGRSMKLGHCVCDPKKPCPCEPFTNHNVCTCAGEKMPVKSGNVKLTKHVRKAGCASKIGQADLLRIIGNLPQGSDPNVLLGSAAGDDAGIYRLDDQHNLVQTVDVFTPCVDDPYLFGQIAAANSVSDIYAMGGRPVVALSIIGFPIEQLDSAIMEKILCGGIDKLQEAGCSVVGGHSINDEEIKCGFAITGLIETENIVKRDGAQPGDVLVLTKPLGTGMVSFASQIGDVPEECLDEVGLSMATLNKDAAELMVLYNANACTDVTGYALAGHLVEMVRNRDVTAEIDMESLPVFAVVQECIAKGIFPGAIERNQEYSMAWVEVRDESEHLPILFDPQTSGGLLISLPEKDAQSLVDEMHKRGHSATSIIGKILDGKSNEGGGKVVVVNTQLQNFIGKKGTIVMNEKNTSPDDNSEPPCCASPPTFDDDDGGKAVAAPEKTVDSGGKPAYQSQFTTFLKSVNAEGMIDKRTKKLMAIQLSIARSCAPCLTIHLKSAVAMGITKAEIDEAAYLAISFCGSPAMILYNEVCARLSLA